MSIEKINLQNSLNLGLKETPADILLSDNVHCLPTAGEEENQKIILANLKKWHSDRKNDNEHDKKQYAHIGFAGLFNLQAACAGRHDIVLLADCNEEQSIFWKDVITLLKNSKTSNDFLKRITEKVKDGAFATYKVAGKSEPIKVREASSQYDWEQNKRIKYLQNSLRQWLDDSGILDSDNYAYLHDLAKNDKILTVDLNIHDSYRIGAIRNWLDSQKIEVRSVYASNILDMERLYIKDIDVLGTEVVPKVKTTRHKDGRLSIKYVDGITGKKLHDKHPFISINPNFSRFNGFYDWRGGRGESEIHLLCNSECSELFQCSNNTMPLITIHGKHTGKLASDITSTRSLSP